MSKPLLTWAVALIAVSLSQAETVHSVLLSGGANGIGPKYLLTRGLLGAQIGLPLGYTSQSDGWGEDRNISHRFWLKPHVDIGCIVSTGPKQIKGFVHCDLSYMLAYKDSRTVGRDSSSAAGFVRDDSPTLGLGYDAVLFINNAPIVTVGIGLLGVRLGPGQRLSAGFAWEVGFTIYTRHNGEARGTTIFEQEGAKK